MTVTKAPPTTVNTPRRFSSVRISFIRNRCTLSPVTPTMSARPQRSKSIASTFSSIRVIVCSPGVNAARSVRLVTGRLARLPRNGSAYSMPQYDTSNRGLIKTMSAMIDSFSRVHGPKRIDRVDPKCRTHLTRPSLKAQADSYDPRRTNRSNPAPVRANLDGVALGRIGEMLDFTARALRRDPIRPRRSDPDRPG